MGYQNLSYSPTIQEFDYCYLTGSLRPHVWRNIEKHLWYHLHYSSSLSLSLETECIDTSLISNCLHVSNTCSCCYYTINEKVALIIYCEHCQRRWKKNCQPNDSKIDTLELRSLIWNWVCADPVFTCISNASRLDGSQRALCGSSNSDKQIGDGLESKTQCCRI